MRSGYRRIYDFRSKNVDLKAVIMKNGGGFFVFYVFNKFSCSGSMEMENLKSNSF